MTSSTLYASAAEVFSAFGQENHGDAPQMTRIIGAVSRMIDGYMNRPDWGFVALATATAAIYTGNGKRHLYLPEFIGVPTVTMKSSIAQTTYDFAFSAGEILPFRGDYQKPEYNGTPYHGIVLAYGARRSRFTNGCVEDIELPTVQVSAKWGYSVTCPPVIKEATIMQCERWYKRERAGMGDAVYNDTLGQFAFFKELDPEVKLMLDKSRLRLPTRIR